MAATMAPRTIQDDARARRQASTQLLSEYLARYWAGLPAFHQMRLGPTRYIDVAGLAPDAIARMLARSYGYADAIVVEPSRLTVWEAAVLATAGKISQAEEYRDLVPVTAELSAYAGRPVRAVILSAAIKPTIQEIARRHGVEWEIYRPEWIAEYLQNSYFENLARRKARRSVARMGGSGSLASGESQAEASIDG